VKPPAETNVLDRHGGFTMREDDGDTVWRPGHLLKKGTTGTLVSFDEKSFYQTNSNATCATYRVPGYRYPVLIWFDNATGDRIA